jgi:hypothetical protein
MISLANIKKRMGISNNDNDELIIEKMKFAFQYVSQKIPIAVTEDESLNESGFDYYIDYDFCENKFIVKNKIILGLKVEDIELKNIFVYDEEYEETELDVSQIKQERRIIYYEDFLEYIEAKISYTSEYGNSYIDDILQDVTIFEFKQLPIVSGSLTKNAENVGGYYSISFKTSEEFYKTIDEKIRKIFLRGFN